MGFKGVRTFNVNLRKKIKENQMLRKLHPVFKMEEIIMMDQITGCFGIQDPRDVEFVFPA